MKSPAHSAAPNHARPHWELPPEWSRQHTAQYQTMLDNTENYLQNEVTSTQPSTKQCQTTLRITSRMKSPAHSPASLAELLLSTCSTYCSPGSCDDGTKSIDPFCIGSSPRQTHSTHSPAVVATVDVDDVVKALLSSQRQNCQGHGYEVRRDLGRWRLGPEKK